MSDFQKQLLYHREKSKLLAKNLTPDQYERALKNLCKRLGI